MRRDLGTFGSLKVNNFFFFVVLLVWGAVRSGMPPTSAYPFLLLLGLLLLVPLSSDPLNRISAGPPGFMAARSAPASSAAAGQPGVQPHLLGRGFPVVEGRSGTGRGPGIAGTRHPGGDRGGVGLGAPPGPARAAW